MEYLNKERARFTIFILSSIFTYGVVEQSRSIIFPIIKDQYELSYTQFGTIVTTTGLAFVLSTFIGTFILKKMKYKKILCLAYFLSALGMLLTAISKNLAFYLVGVHIYYFGFGFEEIGMNSFLSTYFKDKSGRMLSLYHGVWGVGSIVSPYLVNLIVMNDKYAYNIFYYILGGVLSLLLLISLFLKLDNYYAIDEEVNINTALLEDNIEIDQLKTEKRLSYKDAFKDPVILLFIVAMGIQVNVEASALNWAALYLQDVWHLDKIKDGAIFMTSFYVIFTLCRLFFGYFFERIGYLNVMLLSSFGGMVVFIIGFSIGKIGRFVLMFTGFFVAMFWPCLMCSIIEFYGANAPFVTSIVIGWEALFYYLLGFLEGVINDHIGPAWGYRSAIFISFIIFIMVLVIKYLLKKRNQIAKENIESETQKLEN